MIKIFFIFLSLTVYASEYPKRGLKGVQREVTLSMSGQYSTISGFLGYNAGDHAAKVGPWTDESFNDAVKALAPSTIRFPCGTGGNYCS